MDRRIYAQEHHKDPRIAVFHVPVRLWATVDELIAHDEVFRTVTDSPSISSLSEENRYVFNNTVAVSLWVIVDHEELVVLALRFPKNITVSYTPDEFDELYSVADLKCKHWWDPNNNKRSFATDLGNLGAVLWRE